MQSDETSRDSATQGSLSLLLWRVPLILHVCQFYQDTHASVTSAEEAGDGQVLLTDAALLCLHVAVCCVSHEQIWIVASARRSACIA